MQAAFWEDWAFYLQIGWGEEKARRGKREKGGNQNYSTQLRFTLQMEILQAPKNHGCARNSMLKTLQ